MSTFSLDLKRFAEKATGNANAVVRGVTGEIAVRVDERSPVGDPTTWKNPAPKDYVGGRFRVSWQLGVDAVPVGNPAFDGAQPGLFSPRELVAASIPAEPAGHVLYLANNLPYAQRLEDGWSGQAPAGIVGRTAVEFQNIVDQAVAGVQQ